MDNSGLREMFQGALKSDTSLIKEIIAEFAKYSPDIFRRGAGELLKPARDAEYLRNQRKLLKDITDPTVLADALKRLQQQTSTQEVKDLLG